MKSNAALSAVALLLAAASPSSFGLLASPGPRLLLQSHGAGGLQDDRDQNSTATAKKNLHLALQEVASALGLVDVALGTRSLAPRTPRAGRSESVLVPYETRWAPGEGLGLFATEPVKKGQKVWHFRPTDHLEITERDVPVLHQLLKAAHPEVAKWFLRWSYIKNDQIMLFERDDGRFTNDVSSSGKEEATLVSAGLEYCVAARDIQAGEELTEDYEESDMDWVPEWFRFLYKEFDPDGEY